MGRLVIDRNKTLTEIEGDDWGEPDYPSSLVTTCHKMRHSPIGELTNGQVRMAIGQQFSLPILVPLALERLEENPLLQADFYEGDLLKFVLMVKTEFWKQHPDLWRRANSVTDIVWFRVHELDDSWHETVEPDFRLAYAIFLQCKP